MKLSCQKLFYCYDIWKTRLCNSCCMQSFKNNPVAGICSPFLKNGSTVFKSFHGPNIYVSMQQKNCHIINISWWMKCYGNSTKHNWNVCCKRLLRLVWDQLCLAQKAVFRFRRPGKMDGNVGCYKIYTKVLLTISNASLSSGNRKFTNHPVSGFLLAYSVTENLFTLYIIKTAFKFILSIVLQKKKKKKRRRNQKFASRITYAVLRVEGYWLVLYSGCTFWAK